MPRTQIAHPLIAARRISVSAPTELHLELIVRQIRELGADARAGRLAIADALDRIEEKRSGRLAHAGLLVGAAWRAWTAGCSRGTVATAGSAWRHLAELEELACVELTDARLLRWANDALGRGLAPGTVGSYFDMLAAAIRSAVRRGELAEVPWRFFRPPRREQEAARPAAAASLADLAKIARVAMSIDHRRRGAGFFSDLAARVVVSALVGVRNGELAALGWDDLAPLDDGGLLVTVRHQALDGWTSKWPRPRPDFPVKGRRAHVQRVHPDAQLAIAAQRAYLIERGAFRPDGPVFPSPQTRGWRPNAEGIRPAEVRELARLAGLSGRWVTHSLRHSFVTLEVNAPGGSARKTQQRTGHASLAQLERYVHDVEAAPATALGRLELGAAPWDAWEKSSVGRSTKSDVSLIDIEAEPIDD